MTKPKELRLTPTSFIVLGLIDLGGEATPYELKGLAAEGVGNFWSLQHAQLYTETARLAAAGYLDEEREESGRRRKLYRLTARGREALRDWVGDADRSARRAPGPGSPEAVLRRRPQAPRRGAARDPSREARRVRGARGSRNRGALGAGRHPSRRPRPRARVGALLVEARPRLTPPPSGDFCTVAVESSPLASGGRRERLDQLAELVRRRDRSQDRAG